MTSEINPHTTQEPLDDEERELMDPESWDWDSTTPGRTVGTPFAQLCVRFSPEELHALVVMAREVGTGPAEFVRRTAIELIAAQATR
jgi:hypothetical protein